MTAAAATGDGRGVEVRQGGGLSSSEMVEINLESGSHRQAKYQRQNPPPPVGTRFPTHTHTQGYYEMSLFPVSLHFTALRLHSAQRHSFVLMFFMFEIHFDTVIKYVESRK